MKQINVDANTHSYSYLITAIIILSTKNHLKETNYLEKRHLEERRLQKVEEGTVGQRRADYREERWLHWRFLT